jgi:hypothetical protein
MPAAKPVKLPGSIKLDEAMRRAIGVPPIPVGPKWCEIRQIVFGWTSQRYCQGSKPEGFELALVLVRLYYAASYIANANHYSCATGENLHENQAVARLDKVRISVHKS